MADFYDTYYRQLVGTTIVGFKMAGGWPTFTVKKGKKTFEIEISQDPEGNGPGFIFGLERPV